MGTSPIRNRLQLVAAATLFSTGGAAIKAVTLTSWQVASFRSGVAALVLLAVLPEARQGWSRRMLPVAAAYGATLVLFVLATRLTTAAHAIFLQSTAPLYVFFLAPCMLHEPIRRSDGFYVLVLFGGLALLLFGKAPTAATAPDPRAGNLLGLFCGLLWALTLTGLRWLGRSSGKGGGIAAVALGNVLAFLATLPLALPVTMARSRDTLIVLYLGAFQIGLAYVFLTRALRDVPAFEATALLLLEPVMNPIWVWLVHGEKPGPWAVAGGAIILSATLVNSWRARTA